MDQIQEAQNAVQALSRLLDTLELLFENQGRRRRAEKALISAVRKPRILDRAKMIREIIANNKKPMKSNEIIATFIKGKYDGWDNERVKDHLYSHLNRMKAARQVVQLRDGCYKLTGRSA